VTDLLDALAGRIAAWEPKPVLVAVTGAVAVGKTTIATHIADRVAAHGVAVRVISTDSFLYANAELAARDIPNLRKGFPESYDIAALVAALSALRRGDRVELPVYSHATYDLTGEREPIDVTDVLIVEGVVALQPAVRDTVDLGIYVDADADVARGWFIERFLRFVADARADEASFYRMFTSMDDDQVRSVAEATWDGINGVNLAQHIAPTIGAADVVVEKGPDHAVLAVRERA
jgi:type I pantothenate kinase